MNVTAQQFLSLDFPPLLTAVFASVSCALLGNYLVLRRMSLMGDAISHAVLPGIVVAFLLTGSRSSLPVFIGAAIAGVLTALLVEGVKTFGRLETGAAMGVVFSLLFASGVLLIEQAAARSVDLDADCLLNGQLESIFWFPPTVASELFSWGTLRLLPDELVSSFIVLIVTVTFITLLYKELLLTAFDAQLGTALGFHARTLHFALMIFVAGAVVASFEAVGSILVIAMLICPAASARMLTDRMKSQLWLSVLFALLSSVGGYCLGAFAPFWLGFSHSLSASGMMAVVSGILLTMAVIVAPEYGLVARQLRRFILAVTMAREDLLGVLYRISEAPGDTLSMSRYTTATAGGLQWKIALGQAKRRKEVTVVNESLTLTELGKEQGKALVRSHRLWESYLVERLGLRIDHVHERAMELEHFTTSKMQERLAEKISSPATDPHGKIIPE